jgi:hypothetical protein
MNTKKSGRAIGRGNEYAPTQAMVAALRDAAHPARLDPWDFGSSTIGALKRGGFIVVRNGAAKPRRYELTDSGRRLYAPSEPPPEQTAPRTPAKSRPLGAGWPYIVV